MAKEENPEFPEPIERLEEIIPHPADKTFNSLHDQGLSAKKELADERHELGILLGKLPKKPPSSGTKEHAVYLQTQKQIQHLKERISKTHDQLMEILKNEEKISREIQDKNS